MALDSYDFIDSILSSVLDPLIRKACFVFCWFCVGDFAFQDENIKFKCFFLLPDGCVII